MAPGLEEEVVMQVMKEGNDRQYLADKVEALRSLGFKINNNAIKTAIERYEFLQAYNSQDNNAKTRKKRIQNRLDKIYEEEVERLMSKDASIVSVKRYKPIRHGMRHNSCSGKVIQQNIDITRIKKSKAGIYHKVIESGLLFYLCSKCGVVPEEKEINYSYFYSD